MGVRGIERRLTAATLAHQLIAYLRERKLLQTCPLSALSNTRLGIDGAHYIRTLLSEPDSREPLVASTGGLPLALVHRVEADLRNLEALRIKPVFVFAGLPTSSRPPPKGMDQLQERELGVKNEAWTHYENGDVQKAVSTLSQIRSGAWTDWKDVVRNILRIFRHRFVEYIVAPYSEFAQVSVCRQDMEQDVSDVTFISSHTC